LLGISGEASLGDVRRAFRRLAGQLHPDRIVAASPEEQRRTAARFAELSAAYHLLVA
jgi:curved DNA-binding protein CbpA